MEYRDVDLKVPAACWQFIGEKTAELVSDGVDVCLSNGSLVGSKRRYKGCFCGNTKQLKVAMGNGLRSVYVFIHEYAHYLQWKDRRIRFDEGIEGITAVRDLIDNKKDLRSISKKDWIAIAKNLDKVISMEHECEVIASALITSHNIPIDIHAYSQYANMQIMLYSLFKKYRVWGLNKLGLDEDWLASNLPTYIPSLDYFLGKELPAWFYVKLIN